VAGGIDVPLYMGSRATFPNGGFGGYQGRYLRPGDSLPLGTPEEGVKPLAMPEGWMRKYAGEWPWEGVAQGPWWVWHGLGMAAWVLVVVSLAAPHHISDRTSSYPPAATKTPLQSHQLQCTHRNPCSSIWLCCQERVCLTDPPVLLLCMLLL
jgi:hypothetical protein